MIQEIYRRFIWPSFLFAWLRLRIRYNQLSRSSKLAQAFTVLGICVVVVSVIGTWIAGVLVGAFVPGQIGLENYFLIWNVLVAIALVTWLVHVLNEAQRGDPISLDKILHLPVSPGQAFVVNYLSSLGTTVFLMTAGVFTGIIAGSLYSVGWKAVVFAMPAAAFLFAMTSITYLLQGWIANLMANPRKRQTIAVMIPIAIIVVTQVPAQLINWTVQSETKNLPKTPTSDATPLVASPSSESVPETSPANVASVPDITSDPAKDTTPDASVPKPQDTAGDELSEATTTPPLSNLAESLATGNAPDVETEDEKETRKAKQREARTRERMETLERWKSMVSVANVLIPPFWLAGSIQWFVQGSIFQWQPWGLTLVMTLAGIQSLRWSHRSTLRYWRGELTSGSVAVQKRTEASTDAQNLAKQRVPIVERKLPWVSEETSSVATMTWASMIRAPEIKMFMLLPILIPFILFLVVRIRMLPASDIVRAMMICAFSTFTLLIASGVSGNMFAYDRGGFRLFVLSPLRRDRILLGRNLAHLPLIGTLTCFCAAMFGWLYGISLVNWITMVLVIAATLPPYFLVMNLMSIYTPFPMTAGSIQPKHFDFVTVLLNLLLSTVLPIILAVCMAPLAIQALLAWWNPIWKTVPIGLPLAVLIVLASCGLYRWMIPIQGRLLARREKEVLRIVTSKAE